MPNGGSAFSNGQGTGGGPLADLNVVELTSIYSGPYAGMMLAEMGANITKIEGPGRPDPMRSGLGADPDLVNSIFYSLNRGKRFASIDADTERGRELIFDMVANADVFLHNMRAGKAAAMGLSYEALSAKNPRLIDVAINGFGSDGPEADQPVFDYVIQARTGMIDYQRDVNGNGDLNHQLIVDKTSGNAAVQGVLAALYTRERTGLGQQVEIPMIAVGLHLTWTDAFAAGLAEFEPMIPWEQSPTHLQQAPGSFLVVLQTKDGEIATGVLVPPWDGLCLALDKAEWTVDERFAESLGRVMNYPELLEEVRVEVAKYTTEEVLARFAAHDFAAGAVVRREDVFDDVTVKHLELVTDNEADAGDGLGRVRQPSPMWSFSRSGTVRTTSIGSTGRHTREILAEHGLSSDEIEGLINDGVAKVAEP